MTAKDLSTQMLFILHPFVVRQECLEMLPVRLSREGGHSLAPSQPCDFMVDIWWRGILDTSWRGTPSSNSTLKTAIGARECLGTPARRGLCQLRRECPGNFP